MRCTRPETLEYHKGGKTVPCGYCPACKYNQRVGWTFRISEEAKHSKEAWFITLTYDQENIPLLNHETGELERGMENNRSNMCESLDHSDLTTFINSVKKAQIRDYKKLRDEARSPSEALRQPGIKYYAVGEYGGTYGRPHYHIIMFNLWQHIAREDRLDKIWKKGKVQTESLSPALIHYATGYIHEKSKYIRGKQIKPKMYCSKGIGKDYIKRNKQWHKNLLNPWIWFNGYKIGMPQYYKDKIFTEAEMEKVNEKIMEFQSKSEGNDPPPLHEQTRDSRKQWEHSLNTRTRKRNKL